MTALNFFEVWRMRTIVIIFFAVLFVFFSTADAKYNLIKSATGKNKENKHVVLGYADTYEKLPKLVFSKITQAEYETYKAEFLFSENTAEPDGNFLYVKTDVKKHKFKKYKDYGAQKSYAGTELLGYYTALNMYAISESSTAEGLGFSELVLLDKKTDYFYHLISIGDGRVQLPIPSKNHKYLVYFDNAAYQPKSSDICVLKVGDKANPKTYLQEYASYHSDAFAIEDIIWVDDNSLVVKGYEKVQDEGWKKEYQFYKTVLE
jgi:hypothetical protein